jgi:hypothetical protein
MKIIIVSSLLALLAVPAAAYNNDCSDNGENSYRRVLYNKDDCGKKVLNMYCGNGESGTSNQIANGEDTTTSTIENAESNTVSNEESAESTAEDAASSAMSNEDMDEADESNVMSNEGSAASNAMANEAMSESMANEAMGDSNESHRSLYEKKTCGFQRRSLYDKDHDDDDEIYTQCKVPRDSQVCQKVATQCTGKTKCLGANMNTYRKKVNSGEVTKEICTQGDCPCNACRSKGFECGSCRRLYGYDIGGPSEQAWGGEGYVANAGKGISYIHSNNYERNAINNENNGEGNENSAINNEYNGEGNENSAINNEYNGEGNENSVTNIENAAEDGATNTAAAAANDNYRSLQEEPVALDWVAVALQYFNCSEGCLINFYDTNECSDEALRPLSPMAGISLTYSIDDSGKTLGNATIPGPVEQYLDKVIYFHDNLDGKIGINEGKDLCGVFQYFGSDDTTASDDSTAANGSGAIIPRAASYLAGVSVMAAMILAS